MRNRLGKIQEQRCGGGGGGIHLLLFVRGLMINVLLDGQLRESFNPTHLYTPKELFTM